MKYTLCLRKYPSRNQSNFTEIKGFLPAPDCYDLKSICEFTMQFEDARSLKEYLLSKGLITKGDLYRDFNIVYYYRGTKSIRLPYLEDKRFFSMTNLEKIITEEVTNDPAFMDILKTRKYLPGAFFELRYNYCNYQVFSDVREFLYSMCYNKGRFSYKAFYDIAMSVAVVDRLRRKNANNPETPPNNTIDTQASNPVIPNEDGDNVLKRERVLSEPIPGEIEGQMSLF